MLLQFNFFIVLILGIIYSSQNSKDGKNNSHFLFFSFLLLLFIHSLIDIESVSDLEGYEYSYKAAAAANFKDCLVRDLVYPRYEVGFMILEKICTYISSNFRFFVCVYSFILLSFYYRTIKLYSPIIWVSVIALLLSTYNQSLYVMREHLAIAIAIFSYSFIIKRDLLIYVLLMIIAFYIHQSAIVFFPVYFLYGMEKKWLSITTIGLAIVLGGIFDVIYYSLGDNALIVGYESYLEREEGMNLTSVLVNGIFVIVYCLLCRKNLFEPGIYKLCTVISVIGVIASIVGLGFPGMGRAMMYYNSVIILVLPLTIKNIRHIPIKIIYLLFFIGIRYYICFFGTASESIINAKIVEL